jgi:nucleoside-diphosphate-sugar epimerase
MNILITGSSGYLGKNTTTLALKRGHAVVGLDIKRSGMEHPAFREIVDDVTKRETVDNAVQGCDMVFHLAAALAQFEPDERRMHLVNVQGTAHVLSAAIKHRVKKVVYVSSVEVYGIRVPFPCPESAPLNPVCQYGRDKVAAERLCREFLEQGLDITIFRPPTINGPGQNEPFLLSQMEAIARGKPTLLPGGGSTKLQMVHVDDVSSAIFLALENQQSRGLVMNLGSDDVPTLKEMASALYRHAGKKARFINVNATLARVIVHALAKLHLSPLEPQHLEIALQDYVFDTARAKQLLGWRPTRNDIEAAIEAYDWHMQHT